MCVLVFSADRDPKKKEKKYSTKMETALISLFAKGALRLSPLMPLFPSRLIKEKIGRGHDD